MLSILDITIIVGIVVTLLTFRPAWHYVHIKERLGCYIYRSQVFMKDTRLEFVSIERRVGFEGMYIGIPLPKKKSTICVYDIHGA